MPHATYRVTTEATCHTDPVTWWECGAHSASDAAEDYVEADEPSEDCEWDVVVLCPDGKRLLFRVDVSLVRHYNVSLLED